MRNVTINNGSFTANGNFSGYTALGERVHFHKRQMDALGFTTAENTTLPFYAIADIKEFNETDANGKPTDKTFTRLQALSAFKTKTDLVNAQVDNATLDIEVKSAIKSSASSAGLTDAAISQLLNVAI